MNRKFVGLALLALSASIADAKPDYPLTLQVIRIDMQQSAVVSDGDGRTYEWHLMQAVVGNTLYGLSVKRVPFTHNTWLHMGTYKARMTKGGFEVEFADENAKLRHELLHIKSETPYDGTK